MFRQPLPVVLLLSNCRDRSREVARNAAARFPSIALTLLEIELAPEAAHAGGARSLAMNAASYLAPTGGVILTTDADAIPSPSWIAENLRAVAAGADLVGGRLIGDPAEEAELDPGVIRRARAVCRYHDLCDELAALIDPLPYDPWPRHHDHTGGSLAVRADVYRALGGMEPVPFREDLRFVAKARAAGYRLRHPTAVEIVVSARLDGRASGGMADCLKRWRSDEAEARPLLVEAPESVEARLWLRHAIRGFRASPGEEEIRPRGAPPPWQEATSMRWSPTALIERYAADDPDAPGIVPASVAIEIVSRRIEELKADANAA